MDDRIRALLQAKLDADVTRRTFLRGVGGMAALGVIGTGVVRAGGRPVAGRGATGHQELGGP